MSSARLFRLLVLLALPLVLGAGKVRLPPSDGTPGTLASISAPRQSLPPPVHDEATCAFCQAAIFPPCAPQPVAVSLELLGLVRQERAPTDAAPPQFSSHRRTSSRAPPTLRSI